MKSIYLYLVSTLTILLIQTASAGKNAHSEPKFQQGPRPISDRFRNVQRNLTKTDMNTQVDIFKSYGCEHMVVVSNDAPSPILLWCSSGDEYLKEIHVIPEESFAFKFRPKRNGKSVFQCVLNYQEKWATFAVYDEEALHSPPREDSYVYSYSVRNDGVYVNNKNKIKSFFKSFDYGTDDYIYDYIENYDTTLNELSTPTVISQRSEKLSGKSNLLLQAPKAILDRFDVICSNLSQRNFYQTPSTIRDHFNVLSANLSKEDLRTEIDDFANYDCERMVVLSNDATAPFRLWCSSGDDNVSEETVLTGRCFSFSFKPKHNGNSKFQCILNYRGKWVTFYVFNGTTEGNCICMPQQQNSYVRQYSIRHYGIYGKDNTKIKSLFNGRNQYTLWESYDDYRETPYGKLMTGYVDGASDCTTVPTDLNDKAAAITVCDHQCVVAYEHIMCVGRRQVIQANNGCKHVKLWYGLYKELSSVKGC